MGGRQNKRGKKKAVKKAIRKHNQGSSGGFNDGGKDGTGKNGNSNSSSRVQAKKALRGLGKKNNNKLPKHKRPIREAVQKMLNRKRREMFDEESGKRVLDSTDAIVKLDREGNLKGYSKRDDDVGVDVVMRERNEEMDIRNKKNDDGGEDSEEEDMSELEFESGSEEEGEVDSEEEEEDEDINKKNAVTVTEKDEESDYSEENNEKESEDPVTSGIAVQFGKKLSHSEKHIRDKGFKALRSWLKKKSSNLNNLEFIKLWKSLYYCLWMSDKKPVQQDLSVSIAQLARCIPKEKLNNWHSCFFEVFGKEWVNLDIHRMNKFLLMVRIQVCEALNLIQRHGWEEDMIEEWNSGLLDIGPLTTSTSPGLAIHFISIFWEELSFMLPKNGEVYKLKISSAGKKKESVSEDDSDTKKSTKTKGVKAKAKNLPESLAMTHDTDLDKNGPILPPTPDTVIHLLEPFLQVLSDNDFNEQIHQAIVQDILSGKKMPKPWRRKCKISEIDHSYNFRIQLSDELFEMASDPTMSQSSRERLMYLVNLMKDDTWVDGREDETATPVILPLKERKENPNLHHSCAKFKRGLGVRTRNMYKRRQRDTR